MNEIPEDNGQFKMRLDDEIEDSAIASQVGDLRLEKLNQRMTLITILIPVLIVVVLVMAYMDIKKRVVQTEDTGQLTAQTLSENLESRFSNLSLAQALIEENLARLKDQTHQSIAKVQVNLKNLDDSLKQSNKRMASRKDMKAATRKMDKDMGNVTQSIEALNNQLTTLTTSMQSRLDQIDLTLSEDKARAEGIEGKLADVEQTKIDKAAMDLALKLEMLKLKQSFNAQMDDIQSQLKVMDAKIDKQAAIAAQRPAPSTPPPPAPSAPPGTLKEQTIQQ